MVDTQSTAPPTLACLIKTQDVALWVFPFIEEMKRYYKVTDVLYRR